MKLLLVTSKWSSVICGTDGGSVTALNIIDALQGKSEIDVLTCESIGSYVQSDFVKKVLTYTIPQRLAGKYGDKFLFRGLIAQSVAKEIKNLISQYDSVIILHVFHALELQYYLTQEEFNKIILFPMFLTPSYKKVSEEPPLWYQQKEHEAISFMKKIITPSEFEAAQLLDEYKVGKDRIAIVPRFVSDSFKHDRHLYKVGNPVKLSCISSFRKQKRVQMSLPLVTELLKSGVDIELSIIGDATDSVEYQKFIGYLNTHNLNRYVRHFPYMTQLDLSVFLKDVDFNVSFSSCETFGRAIHESLYSGVPNIILDDNGDFRNLIKDGHGAIFCKSIQEMTETIVFLANNASAYSAVSEKSARFGSEFSERMLKEKLLRTILQ